ncbi:MAG: hypothetical protein ACI9NT_000032 [Bacteroidia bacterium]|jgi:hypothetical protein
MNIRLIKCYAGGEDINDLNGKGIPMKRRVLLLVVFALPLSRVSVAQELSQSDCQQLRDTIERYTKLRRGGGSARQMESWKKSRKRYEDRFSKGNCYKYGAQLE